jgi:PAS domain S-box-containing protein
LTEFTKELEQKVAQRTGELEMANQKLRAETLELHKTQKALQDSTTMLNAIFDSTSQAFMLLDLNLNVLALNKKIDELTKPPYQPLKVGDNLLTYVPPRNREYLLDSFAQVLAGKSVVREREIYSPEGVRIGWFEYIYNPVFDEQGKVVAVCLCYNNIEQRKLAEFQIRHNAEKMHLLGEITEALAKVDLDYANIFELAAQRIAQLFEAECAIFQLSPQEDFLQLEGLFTVNSTDSLLMNSFRTVQFKVPPVFEQSIILNNVSARSLISRILPDFESEPAKVQVLFKRQLNSLMTPIKVNNKFRGIISLSNTALDKSFLPEDGDFLKEIADRVGLAIQNVNLRKELKSRDQLEAVHALARTLAHDLTQPLTILQGELDFILQLGESPSDEVLEAMQEAVTQITNKVRQYQKIIRYRTTEGPIGQMVE